MQRRTDHQRGLAVPLKDLQTNILGAFRLGSLFCLVDYESAHFTRTPMNLSLW